MQTSRNWTEEELLFLQKNCKNKTIRELANELGRTYDSVRGKLKAENLNVKVDKRNSNQGQAWTEEELKFLREHHAEYTIAQMSEILGRKTKSVHHRLYKEKLSFVASDRKGFIHGTEWTNEEIQYLYDHKDETPRKIGKDLNRTERSVYAKMMRLGIASPSTNAKKWTQEEEDFLYDNYAERGGSYVAKKLGRSVLSVQKKAETLGVSAYDSGYLKLNHLAGILKIEPKVIIRWINGTGLKCQKVRKANSREIASYNIAPEDFWTWADKHRDLVNWKRYELGALEPEPKWIYEAIENDKHSVNEHIMFRTPEIRQIINEQRRGIAYKDIAERHGRSVYSIKKVISTYGEAFA